MLAFKLKDHVSFSEDSQGDVPGQNSIEENIYVERTLEEDEV